jgi:hypothetical protein
MKEFFTSKFGRAVAAGLSTAIIWAICTPIFDLLFHGGIHWDAFKYVGEPILIGIFMCIFECIFPMPKSTNGTNDKKTKK